jgi:pSer/pThr/pTyr-binding forkhead associated (FHA) protein
MASLMVVSGKSRGCYVELEECPTTMGRDERCNAQILDELVSRRHLEVRFWAVCGRYQVVDLNSANGVFLNEQRVGRPTLLREGDVITIGETRIIYSEQDLTDCEAADDLFRVRGQTGRSTIIPGVPWPFRSRPARSAWKKKVPA